VDCGEYRPGRLGAARDGGGRAFELADHPAEFQFEQFEDLLGGIGLGRTGNLGSVRGLCRLRLDRRRGWCRRVLSKQSKRHELLGYSI
jgi:hypothetical protein